MNEPKPDREFDDAIAKLDEVIARLEEEERDIGLEYAGREMGSNRAQRRSYERIIKRVTRRPEACMQLRHPLLGTLTPHGAKVLRQRRAKKKVARASRKRNRRAR